jgi:hypothetical protein
VIVTAAVVIAHLDERLVADNAGGPDAARRDGGVVEVEFETARAVAHDNPARAPQ